MPTFVLKTTDGMNYTDLTSTVTDGDPTTSNAVALDTAANNKWLLIGFTSPVYSVFLDIATPNGTAGTLLAQFSASSTAGDDVNNIWSSLTYQLLDRTNMQTLAAPAVPGGTTGATSGYLVQVLNGGVSSASMNRQTQGGHLAYWMRISASVALTIGISEIRVITDTSNWIFRGRPATTGDITKRSWVWEPYDAISPVNGCPLVTGLAVIGGAYPHRRGLTLVASLEGIDLFYQIGPPSGIESGAMPSVNTALAITPRIDFGMPATKKQFMDITIKGKTLDATRAVAVSYRLDTSTTWISAGATVTSSPTTLSLSNVSGYSIQLKVALSVTVATNDQTTEINLLQVRCREQPVFKRVFSAMVAVADKQVSSGMRAGGLLPNAKVQVTNLEAMAGTQQTLVDPVFRAITVDVYSVQVLERYQTEEGVPALAVGLVMSEV